MQNLVAYLVLLITADHRADRRIQSTDHHILLTDI
jgi:phosphopentomutase